MGSPEDAGLTVEMSEGAGCCRTWKDGLDRDTCQASEVRSCVWAFYRAEAPSAAAHAANFLLPDMLHAYGVSPLPQPQGPETAPPDRQPFSTLTSWAQGCFSFPLGGVFFQELTGPSGQSGGGCDQMAVSLALPTGSYIRSP